MVERPIGSVYVVDQMSKSVVLGSAPVVVGSGNVGSGFVPLGKKLEPSSGTGRSGEESSSPVVLVVVTIGASPPLAVATSDGI